MCEPLKAGRQDDEGKEKEKKGGGGGYALTRTGDPIIMSDVL